MTNGKETVVRVRSFNPNENLQEWKFFEIITNFEQNSISLSWSRNNSPDESLTFLNVEPGNYHLVMMVSTNSTVKLINVEDIL